MVLKASVASMTSKDMIKSLASMTSTASLVSKSQKLLSGWFPCHPEPQQPHWPQQHNDLSGLNDLDLIDIWNSFCWRLWRPWMLHSTKFKGHMSNFRISGMYRFCFYDLYVHFWWPNKSSKHQVLSVNTLYLIKKCEYRKLFFISNLFKALI